MIIVLRDCDKSSNVEKTFALYTRSKRYPGLHFSLGRYKTEKAVLQALEYNSKYENYWDLEIIRLKYMTPEEYDSYVAIFEKTKKPKKKSWFKRLFNF